MFTTPILFIVFNRPSTTKQVFDRIRLIKPKYLYVAADGPRVNNSSDIQNCNQVKSIINEIDWDCELKTLYRDENLGCGVAPSQAIRKPHTPLDTLQESGDGQVGNELGITTTIQYPNGQIQKFKLNLLISPIILFGKINLLTV